VPNNKALRARKAAGRLQLNFSTIALEAGHSRTLIGFKKCKYPQLRRDIQAELEARPNEPTSLAEVVSCLRQDLLTTRAELKFAKAEALVHFHERERAEAEKVRWKSAYDKLLSKSKQTQGTVVSFRDSRE
jgi:hypothetical protein